MKILDDLRKQRVITRILVHKRRLDSLDQRRWVAGVVNPRSQNGLVDISTSFLERGNDSYSKMVHDKNRKLKFCDVHASPRGVFNSQAIARISGLFHGFNSSRACSKTRSITSPQARHSRARSCRNPWLRAACTASVCSRPQTRLCTRPCA